MVRVRKRDFSKHFSNVEDNTLIIMQLNRGRIADLSLLRTLLAICQVVRAKFLGVILFFNSISKFGGFKNGFAIITGLSELHFHLIFVLFAQMREIISTAYGSSGSS